MGGMGDDSLGPRMSQIEMMDIEQTLRQGRERRRKREKFQTIATMLGAEVARRTTRQVVSSLAEDYGDEIRTDRNKVVEEAIELLKTQGIETTYEEMDQQLHDMHEFIIDDDYAEDPLTDDDNEGEK